jgi:hypothetical protein
MNEKRINSKTVQKYKECKKYIDEIDKKFMEGINSSFCYDKNASFKQIIDYLLKNRLLYNSTSSITGKNITELDMLVKNNSNITTLQQINSIKKNKDTFQKIKILFSNFINIQNNQYSILCTYELKEENTFIFNIINGLLLKYGNKNIIKESDILQEIVSYNISPKIYYSDSFYRNDTYATCVYMYEDLIDYITLGEYINTYGGQYTEQINEHYQHNYILLINIMYTNRFTNKRYDKINKNSVLEDVYVDPHNAENMFKIKDFTFYKTYDEEEDDEDELKKYIKIYFNNDSVKNFFPIVQQYFKDIF